MSMALKVQVDRLIRAVDNQAKNIAELQRRVQLLESRPKRGRPPANKDRPHAA